MKKFGAASLFCLIIVLSRLTPVIAGMGDLQVTCEPGIRVFVDNVFRGVTKESDGGLFVPDLAPGPHAVKVLKKGLPPYEKTVVIKESVAVEIEVSFSGSASAEKAPPADTVAPRETVAPLPPERREPAVQAVPTGALALRSSPPGAVVILDGEKKSGTTDMLIEHVRAGRRALSFQREGRSLSGIFVVEPDKTLELKADFANGVIVNPAEPGKNEPGKDRVRPAVQVEKAALPAKEAAQEPQVVKGPGKGGAVPRPATISEAARPYGELNLEVLVSRETPTFYRDSLAADFPDRAIPADHLLDSHFTDTRGLGDDIKYQSTAAGRSISCTNIIPPQQGRVAKTSTYIVSVKEGSYTMAVSRKRWKVDFFSDRSVFNKASQETIEIKRGARLHVKIRYAPDKDDNYLIEKTYEPVSGKFYENVDLLLMKKPGGRK